MTNTHARLVLFDVDGTLLDSRGAIVAAMATAFIRCKLTPPSPAEIRARIGLSVPDMVAVLAGERRDVPLSRIVAAYTEAYFTPSLLEAACDLRVAGLAAMLEEVNTPDTLMGLVTGKARRSLQHALASQQLDQYFTVSVTADDGPSKPAGDMVMLAMNEVGFSAEQTVVVGDTTYDIEMAHAAGVPAIGVSWGYHGQDALAALGVPVAGSMSDLPALIEDIRPTARSLARTAAE